MFEHFRETLRDLLGAAYTPEARRAALSQMRQTLVHARLALDEMREGAAATRTRLATERAELETVRRRKGLAANIHDRETVAIAERYEARHAERVVVLERKLAAEDDEVRLFDAELAAMTRELKAAAAGVGGAAPGHAGVGDGPLAESGVRELEALERAGQRAAREAEADAKLAALKRRMGQ